MASAWVDNDTVGVFDDDLPEPPIPTRAARAARLAALPFRCTHTGCGVVVAEAGQCTLHQGCEFGAHRHPCPAAAEIEEAEYEAREVGA